MEPKRHEPEINFQKYWAVIQRHFLPASGVFGIILLLTTLAMLKQKPIYEAESKLLFKSSPTSTLTGLGEGIGKLEALTIQNNPLDTQAEVVRSGPILQEVIEALQLKDEDGQLLEADDLAQDLVVKAVRGTEVMRISYKAGDPKVAAAVTNKIVEVFIKNNLRVNRAEAVSARKFIAEQLPKTEVAVMDADSALSQFKERNNIVVLSEEATATVGTISTLQRQITEASAQLADVAAQSNRLQRQVGSDPQQAVLYSTLSQSSGVQDVLGQLQQAQRELVVAETRFIAGPAVEKLRLRVGALENLLQERVNQIAGNNTPISMGNLQVGKTGEDLVPQMTKKLIDTEVQRVGLAERINVLSNTYTRYRERAKILPVLEKTERELKRKLEASQKTYEALLSRLQEIQVAENQNIGNARIISPALIPTKATASKKKIVLGLGLIIGLLLAIATAFILDLIDRSIKTIAEARSLFGYTLLGVIPAYDKQTKLHLGGSFESDRRKVIAHCHPLSPINTAYQMLQANLRFLSSDEPLRAIVVTSSMDQEGKSDVSANLATVISQAGHQVLLVDAEMRNPMQHHLWNLTNVVGLSDVLVDQVQLGQAIQKMNANLSILPSGTLPPNPLSLLDSKRMAAIVAELVNKYDFVIFDTPSLSSNADAAVLGKMADGILLVVQPGTLDSTRALATKNFLSQAGHHVLGMVVNNVNIKHEPDSYFYYTEAHKEQTLQVKNISTSK